MKKNREFKDDNAPAKAGTRILPCGCKSAFQDDTYGIGRRVHNVTKAGGSRCTVCLKTK